MPPKNIEAKGTQVQPGPGATKKPPQKRPKGPCPWLCNLVPNNVPPPALAQTVLHPRKDVFVLKTVGAAFCAKAMQSNGRNFNIGIWDTAGSERYEAMTKIYYRGAHAAIICYEPSSVASWARLRHWLQELRGVEENCKVYLCGTKKDLLDGGYVTREVPEDTVESYSQGLRGHFFTSSKTGENVEELFQKIVDDCAADVELMKNVEDMRVQLQKEEVAYRAKSKDYCFC